METKKIYVALGDSLADARTYLGKDWTSYPMYFHNWLVDSKALSDSTLINDAIGGYKTIEVMNDVTYNPIVREDIKKANIITINIGGNNIIQCALHGLVEQGYMDENMNPIISSPMDIFKMVNILSQSLTNKDSADYKYYIHDVKDHFVKIIAEIRKLNADAEIYLAPIYVAKDTATGRKYLKALLGNNAFMAQMFEAPVRSAAMKIQSYARQAIANADKCYYVDTDELCNADYLQHNKYGQADVHPVEAGQLKMAECFKTSYLSVHPDKTKADVKISNRVDTSVFPAVNLDMSSPSGLTTKDTNTTLTQNLSIENNALKLSVVKGMGAKVMSVQAVINKRVEYRLKPCKAKGIATAVSHFNYYDNSELIIRFNGVETDKLWVAIGNAMTGEYEGRYISLGFDASLGYHYYGVDYTEDDVKVIVDGKVYSTGFKKPALFTRTGGINVILSAEVAEWLKEEYDSSKNYASYVDSMRELKKEDKFTTV